MHEISPACGNCLYLLQSLSQLQSVNPKGATWFYFFFSITIQLPCSSKSTFLEICDTPGPCTISSLEQKLFYVLVEVNTKGGSLGFIVLLQSDYKYRSLSARRSDNKCFCFPIASKQDNPVRESILFRNVLLNYCPVFIYCQWRCQSHPHLLGQI